MNTIFETLRHQHDSHVTLLNALAEADSSGDDRAVRFDRLKQALSDHAIAEERAFYSVLLSDPMTQPKSSHSIHEHQNVESKLEQLSSMPLNSPNWLRTLRLLREMIEHHESEEERDIFPLAGKALSEGQKSEMSMEFERVRAQLS